MTKLERLRIALFLAVRNNAVLPKGLALGKSMDEIDRMSYETYLEIMGEDIVDLEKAKESFERGKELYETEVNDELMEYDNLEVGFDPYLGCYTDDC